MKIYETNNAGAVREIYAYDEDGNWASFYAASDEQMHTRSRVLTISASQVCTLFV